MRSFMLDATHATPPNYYSKKCCYYQNSDYFFLNSNNMSNLMKPCPHKLTKAPQKGENKE
jgi:hypothetical protein